jgi:hypothetical protein
MRNGTRFPSPSPYRQSVEPREAEPPREVSLGFMTCFLVLLVVLIKALSAEPAPTESAGPGASHPVMHSRGVGHHR